MRTVFDNGGYVGVYADIANPKFSQLVTDGLKMHLDAGNPASYSGSGTTWSDLTGTVTAGTVNGATFSSSNGGGSLSFSGASNSYATFANSTALDTQTPTVEVWVKPGSLGQSGFWFEKGSVNTQYSLFQASGYIYWRMVINGSLVDMTILESTAGLVTSAWNHMVATYASGTGRRLYRNGALVGSDSTSGTVATNASGMSVACYGGNSGSYSYFYNGAVAVVRIYNRALSLAEVQKNYNDQKSRFGL